LRIADRAEQDRRRRLARSFSVAAGSGSPCGVVAGTADTAPDLQLEAVSSQRLEHLARLRR
jgi:hypothetical protein